MREDAAFCDMDPTLSFDFFPPKESALRLCEFLEQCFPTKR